MTTIGARSWTGINEDFSQCVKQGLYGAQCTALWWQPRNKARTPARLPPPPYPLIPQITYCGSHVRPVHPQAYASVLPSSLSTRRGAIVPYIVSQRVKIFIQEGVASIYPPSVRQPELLHLPSKHRQAGVGGRTFQGDVPRSGDWCSS